MTKNKVILVPFPFDDLTATKVRPVVCLTNPIGPHHHVIVGFITSRIPTDPLDSDFIIGIDDQGFSETGLRVPSALRLHRLITLSTDIFVRELGRLSDQMEGQVDNRLRALFGL